MTDFQYRSRATQMVYVPLLSWFFKGYIRTANMLKRDETGASVISDSCWIFFKILEDTCTDKGPFSVFFSVMMIQV